MTKNASTLENGDQDQLATVSQNQGCCNLPCFLKVVTGVYLTVIVVLAFLWSGYGVHESSFLRQVGCFGFIPGKIGSDKRLNRRLMLRFSFQFAFVCSHLEE